MVKADFDAFLKEYWTPARKEKTRFDDHPLLAMIPKDEGAAGDFAVTPIDLHDGGEGAANFAIAQAISRSTSSQKKQFVHDWTEAFDIATVPNSLIRMSRNAEYAMAKAAEEYKKCESRLSNKLARGLYRTGYGEKGVISSISTSTITLVDASDSRFFSIGDELVFADSVSGDLLRDGGDYVSVTKVDHDAGTITTDATPDLATKVTGTVAGDFIFAHGDREDSATPTRLLMPGLQAWIPDSAPSSTTFGGIDRTVWVSRLAGLRYPASGSASGPIVETFLRALAHGGNYRAKFTHCFASPDVYADLLVSLEGQRGMRTVTEKVGTIGFSGFEINTGYTPKPLKVFVDGDCPPKRAYALNLDTWKLLSLGELIQDDLMGSKGGARDVDDASAIEWRRVFHGALVCNDPGQNEVIKFA